MKSRWLVAFGFLGAILAGAVFFALPFAGADGRGLPVGDALFTACSAVCITGLTVIEPGVHLSRAGQIGLMLLVQLGCVGIMTFGTFLLVAVGRRLSFGDEFSLVNAYGATGVKGFRGLVAWVVLSMLAVEALGAVALWWHFTGGFDDGAWAVRFRDDAAWYRAVFYSVMAFCNAGFTLDPGSLSVFRAEPFVLVTMGCEVLLGGIGFIVLYNLATIKFWRRNLVRRGRLTLHSQVVLASTGIFLVFAFVAILALESSGALRDCASWGERLAVTFFHAVTPRTCGFTVVDMEDLRPATRFLSEVLMFIGAAPGSAGGGVKVTTFVVFLFTFVTLCRARRDTVVFRRCVPEAVVRESLVIFFLFAFLVVAAMAVLLVSENGREGLTFERLLFETISAVSTTGLSCGDTTARLSAVGRGVVMACMFCGRLGAIAIVSLIGGEPKASFVRYSKEELVVG